MSGPVRTFHPRTSPVRGERFVDLGYRWFLSTFGVVSALLGSALWADGAASSGPETSLAMFLVGWGATAVLFSLLWWRMTPRPVGAPGSTGESVRPSTPVRPTTTTAPRPAFGDHLTPSFGRRGSEWRVLSLPANPGDETWISWLPRETRRLGAEAVGASRRAIYSASHPGSLVAVPNRTQGPTVRSATMSGDFALSSRAVRTPRTDGGTVEPVRSPATLENLFQTPPPPAAKAHKYTEEELDRLFPPSPGEHTPFLTGVPQRVGVRDSSAHDRPSGGFGPGYASESLVAAGSARSFHERNLDTELSESPRMDVPSDRPALAAFRPLPVVGGSMDFPGRRSNADDLYLEATNPIPPHLRGTDLFIGPRPARRLSDVGVPKSVCASCSKVVVNLRMSGPCPRCLRPICSECLREAILAHGQGSCLDCAAPTSIVAAC